MDAMSELPVIFEDRMYPGEWRVQWSDGGGEIETTIFIGHNSRKRAIHYAEWQYGVFEEVRFDP